MKTILIAKPTKLNRHGLFKKQHPLWCLLWRLQFKKITLTPTQTNAGRCPNCAGGVDIYDVECAWFGCPCARNQQLKRKYTFIHLKES